MFPFDLRPAPNNLRDDIDNEFSGAALLIAYRTELTSAPRDAATAAATPAMLAGNCFSMSGVWSRSYFYCSALPKP